MAEKQEAHEAPVDEDALRQQLLRRIGLAGVLIVALVASLAMFDAVFVEPPAPPAEIPAALPVAPVEAAAEQPAETSTETQPETPPAAESAPEPAKEAVKEAEPAKSVEPAKPAVREESKPITLPQPKIPAKTVAAAPERTSAPSLPPPPPEPVAKVVPPQRPLTQAVTQRPVAANNYLVQMGVFSNVANAEELKTRLDKAGIPAHIEARVQVGPFKSKTEAEAAQKKLADMGLSGLLLSPRK